jgi:hypothetical protein
MRAAAWVRSAIRESAFSARATASLDIRRDRSTWSAIFCTDEVISVVAPATDLTLAEASSDEAATVVDSFCVLSAVVVNLIAALSSVVAFDDTA